MSETRRPQRTTIETAADIRTGVRALRRKCSAMRRIHDLIGDPPLRRHVGGFEGLARTIVSQQLSAASASAIWTRTSALMNPVQAAAFLSLSDQDLKGTGLSAGKIRALRAAAHAIEMGSLDLEATEPLPALVSALTGVHGVGPWTADIYVLFCLGYRDAFAPGDLALQVATESALGLEKKPTTTELELISERWRPWRGVAARLLWAYYPLRRAAP